MHLKYSNHIVINDAVIVFDRGVDVTYSAGNTKLCNKIDGKNKNSKTYINEAEA